MSLCMLGMAAEYREAGIACNALWQAELSQQALCAVAGQVGSDVAFAVLGGTAVGRGRGEQLSPALAAPATYHWVLAFADGHLSTPAVYAALDRFAVIVTAPGTGGTDFVSRFFAPARGVDEDPVTGSSHCTLSPYWAGRLGKHRLAARQLSRRGGALSCALEGDWVTIAGRAVLYLEGTITI